MTTAAPEIQLQNHSVSVRRSALLISTHQLDVVSRWDVVGNVNRILKALDEIGALENWHEQYLINLEEVAKESL
jgi:hypothetical protein